MIMHFKAHGIVAAVCKPLAMVSYNERNKESCTEEEIHVLVFKDGCEFARLLS